MVNEFRVFSVFSLEIYLLFLDNRVRIGNDIIQIIYQVIAQIFLNFLLTTSAWHFTSNLAARQPSWMRPHTKVKKFLISTWQTSLSGSDLLIEWWITGILSEILNHLLLSLQFILKCFVVLFMILISDHQYTGVFFKMNFFIKILWMDVHEIVWYLLFGNII